MGIERPFERPSNPEDWKDFPFPQPQRSEDNIFPREKQKPKLPYEKIQEIIDEFPEDDRDDTPKEPTYH